MTKAELIERIAENVGFGLDKIESNWQLYNQTTPEILREFDSTIMKLAIKDTDKDTDRDTDTWGEKWGEKWGDHWEQHWPEIENWWKQELHISLNRSEIKILDMIAAIPDVSMLKLAETIGIVETAIGNNIKKLKEKEIIQRVGPAKGGYWKIIK